MELIKLISLRYPGIAAPWPCLDAAEFWREFGGSPCAHDACILGYVGEEVDRSEGRLGNRTRDTAWPMVLIMRHQNVQEGRSV